MHKLLNQHKPMSDSRELRFSYDCDDSIDANTLLTSQLNFINAINELQKELYPEAHLKIKIKPFDKGSFIVNLLFETSWIENLFTIENIVVIPVIIENLEKILNIREKLNLKKAKIEKEIDDQIEIITDGNVKIKTDKKIFNIHRSNRTLDDSINRSFEPLIRDESIKGISIKDCETQREYLNMKRDLFPRLIGKNQYFDHAKDGQIHYEQVLYIKKPNLYPEEDKICQWGFIYRGRDISAKMLDLGFLQFVNNGLRVAKGDRLICDLKIYMKYDEQLMTDVETNKFDVMKVHKLVERPEHPKFPFKE
jgi:hypothetical protein